MKFLRGSLRLVSCLGSQLTLLLGCLLVLPQCKGEFTGPYPCETGYDSCIEPQKNLCETNTVEDAAHCGACGRACGVGALCSEGQCGSPAQELGELSASIKPYLAVAGDYLYWSQTSEGTVYRIPVDGGPQSTVATNVNYCGSVVPFAVDAQALYYWTNSFTCTGSPCISTGMVRMDLATQVATVAWTSPEQSSNTCAFGVAVNSTGVYELTGENNNLLLYGAAFTDSTLEKVAGVSSNGPNMGLALDDVAAWFVTSNNGPFNMTRLALSDGKKTEFRPKIGDQELGINTFVSDAEHVYIAAGGCPCDSNSSGQLPTGSIVRFNADGTGGVTLATFTGLVSSMVRDDQYIYWATDTTLWKVPALGGEVQRVAGNLSGGDQPYLCEGTCGMQPPVSIAIAVDDHNAYIADASSKVTALLRVAK
jgi:hypothetical protein